MGRWDINFLFNLGKKLVENFFLFGAKFTFMHVLSVHYVTIFCFLNAFRPPSPLSNVYLGYFDYGRSLISYLMCFLKKNKKLENP